MSIHHDDDILNPSTERRFADIVDARYHRRDVLKAAGIAGAFAALGSLLAPARSFAQTSLGSVTPLSFTEIAKSTSITHHVAEGYDAQLLIRWGDRIVADAPEFDPLAQTPASQLGQFGYNNDFLAYVPFPQGSDNSNHGLLCSNHEYTSTHLMFPQHKYGKSQNTVTQAECEIEMAAHGHGVVEIRRQGAKWEPVLGSPYNRRMNMLNTKMDISGPAAGHARLKTKADPEGKTVIGTLGNCAGGVTPWHSVLVAEENFNYYFGGDPSKTSEAKNHERYGLGETWYGWSRFHDRFDVEKEPNEPNRYGWVVEYDPYDPKRTPVKRTWLGRFKHETATTTLAPNGRVVIYSGDDERFEYLYRFVSTGKYNPNDRAANFGLLDDGMLYAAKFADDGSMEWLPLQFGTGKLTPENGFHSQGDVLLETRRAGDMVGATPMDRPEGIAVHESTGRVFLSLTNNSKRTEGNAANPRINNIHGHIIELLAPSLDHAATKFTWKIFLRAGNPAVAGDDAFYPSTPSAHGWLSCPDNLTLDPSGNLWIGSDGQPKTLGLNDGLYATTIDGEFAGATKLFFTGPTGCEITGPCFTPNGSTLFVAVQHPGDEADQASFETPATRWPDFKDGMPPRPSVVAITKKDGGRIGS